MEYIKGKNIISKLMKSALSIGIFIALIVAIPYIAIFVIRALFFISVFGVLGWYSFKLVKYIKNHVNKLSTNKNADIQDDRYNSKEYKEDGSIDINYEDSVIIDVDYEKIE